MPEGSFEERSFLTINSGNEHTGRQPGLTVLLVSFKNKYKNTAMKIQQLIFLAFLIFLMTFNMELFAQRRVISTPRRTVVQSPRGTVVYRKRPVVKPIRRLPRQAVVVNYHSRPYYYHSGLFYVSRNGTYARIAPPIGIRVAVLPTNYVRLVIGSRIYFYAEGVFYVNSENNDEYTVADPPVGMIVSELPTDAAEIEIDGKPFFEYNGTIYKPIRVEKQGYEVVGKLNN